MAKKNNNIRIIDIGNDWTIKEAVFKLAGFKRHTKYYYKNKVAPRVEIKTKVAAQLAGYALIEKDLRNILVWLHEIEATFPRQDRPSHSSISPDRKKFNIIKGLFVASLTFYGKCFAVCEGRRIKLEKSWLDEKYRTTHDKIINARHNFAAHSGADKFEEVYIALVFSPRKKDAFQPILYKELLQADLMLFDETEVSFLELVTHAQDKVLDKIRMLEGKILDEEIYPKGKEYWYRKAKK